MAWDAVASGPPPAGELPADGECHLWVARIGEDDARRRSLLVGDDLLAVGPAARVESDRRTLLASRAAQRLVAARYRDTDPHRVVIRRDCVHCGSRVHGRPRLADGGPPDYSVSHAGDWIVIAVVGAGRVGVDLERQDSPDPPDELAAAVLGPAESVEYRSLPPAERAPWFHRVWVRKEASTKLTDRGLVLDAMQRIDVRGATAEFSDESGRPFPDGGVRLRDLPAPRGYVAALATTCAIRRVPTFRVTA